MAAAGDAPAKKQLMTVDPQSPAFDTTHDAARALGDKLGAIGANEQAAGIIQGTDGKYRYTTPIGGSNDNFEMHLGLRQGEKLAAYLHSHPGMDDLGKVFSPNDLDVANKLKVPSYVKFAADKGAIRVYTPGSTKTRTMQRTGHLGSVNVADGDELPAAASAPTAGPAGPAAVPVSGMELSDAPARPAYWDAPMGEGAAPKAADDAASMGRQSVEGPDAEKAPDRLPYWDAPMAAEPEKEAPPAAAPKEAESTFGTDVLTGIGAHGAQVYHAANEAMANHKFSSAREEFYKTMVLGDAVRDAAKAGIALTDDPVVQEIAKHVGMRPDQFTRNWPEYANLSEQEKQKRLGELQQQMVEATGNIAEASHGRALAGQVSREAMPREHQFAYKALTMAPEILGGLTLSAVPGGQLPAAAMFMSDFGLTSYAQARDSGASDDQAKVYGVLSGLAATVPQVPVMAALQKTPAAQALMQTAIGKVLAQNAAGRVAGSVASQATNESLALAVQNTLQIAIDKGVLDQNTTLGDALRTIGEGALMGATFGSFSGVAHSGINRLVNGPHAAQGPGASDAMTNRILEAQHTAMDTAQTHAEQAALDAGGDALDGKVAAIQANAHVSAEHDAAAVHQTRVEFARKSAEDEMANAQAAEEELKKEQDFGAAERQAGKVSDAPSADEAFAQREQQGALAAKRQEAQKDRDFVPAKNQAADQNIAQAEAEEKGGPAPAKPTLAEGLPTEQVSALQALRDRLAAQRSANEPAKETTAAERLKAQNPEDDFQQLGPEVPPKAKAPEKAPEPVEDEEEPTGGPPPVTAQTLAERRQQALDEKMAAKVRGEQPTVLVNDKPTPVPGPREGTPAAEGKPANRLAQRRAMAAKTEDELAAAAAPTAKEETPAPATAEAPIAAPEAAPAPAKPNRMAAIRAAQEKRNGRQKTEAEQSIIDELRAGRAKKDEEPSRMSTAKDKPTRPQDVEVSKGANTHNYRLGDAVLSAKEDKERGITRGFFASVPVGMRGRGIGTSLLERAVQDAHARGQVWHSDDRVSDMQQGTYNSLRDRGYDVRENPNETGGSGEKVSASELKGVYEVHPSKEPARRKSTDPFEQQPLEAHPEDIYQAAEDLDRAANPRMTKEDANAHLKPVLDKLNPGIADRTHVHGTKEDALALPDSRLSPKAKADLASFPGVPAGMYDPDTNTVHIFGDGHLNQPADDGRPGGQSEVIKTLAHEYTHLGLRNILGDGYADLMRDVISKVQNRQLAQDIRWTRGFDPSIDIHRVVWGDEYIAYLSEDTKMDPGLWRTVVDGIRRLLRKAGLVRDWTDDDIRDLIRRNNPMLGEVDPAARAALAYKGDGPRFSPGRASDHQIDRDLDPTDPKAIQYKLARTVEEQMDANRGSIDSRNAWDNFVSQAQKTGRNLAEWGRGTNDNKRLGWIGLRNLMDFMRKDLMPDLHGFIDDHDAMDGMRGRLVNEGADIARKWSKWQAKQDDRGWGLSELMHSSTLLGHDASKPYESQYSKEELAESPDKRQDDRYQRALHAGLKKSYEAMDPEGRELYNTVRDHYSTARQRIFDALTRRIEETGADENTKKQLMAELRQRFEAGRVKGVYFPLQRFGNRWGRAMDADGNHVAFSRFENKDDQDQWLKHMRDQGLTVDKGQQIDSKSEMERIDPDFVKKVMTLAHDADSSGELEKEIWQTYLKAMPEMSMRKHFIMRQGRLGFSQDALRAFAYNSFHGSHQQARLEYGNRLDTRLANVKKQAEALATASAQNPGDRLADKNSEWGAALAKELEQRLDWIKNPRSSPWASNMTKFGFLWYLGAAPATALRISLQNTMLAQPQIARHFGQIGATKELSKAVLQWAGARGKLSDKLRGDERAAFERAADMGIFSNTNTTMLASGGEGAPMTGAYDKFQRVAGYLFNAMEHKNRMTTFLATYRLGVKKGMSTDDAFKLARNVTWDSHFDYTNANRPGVLQNDFAKVAGLFRQYAWGVTYRLGRDLRDSFKADSTKEERLSAAHAFSNTMARMMLYAGVTGVGIGFPVYGLISGLTNAIMNQVDPDRPFDMTSALHEHLQDHLGKTAADSIMTGPASQITGAALSRGASYNDMWYKPPDREMKGRDQVMDAMGQFLGPVAAIPINAVTGADMMAQGHFERGLEHFLPPESAALAKSLRYSSEGAKNLKGDTVVDKKDLSKWDIAVQGAGFTPEKIARQFATNTEKQNYIDRVQTRKQALSTNLRAAIVASDDKEERSVLKQVDHFNTAHPADAIGWREVQQIRSEARAAALSDHGVREPKGLREEVQRKFK